jgi:hypothetical protein
MEMRGVKIGRAEMAMSTYRLVGDSGYGTSSAFQNTAV